MDQMRALFLVSPAEAPHNNNHDVLPDTLYRYGWTIEKAEHEALASKGGRLFCGDHDLAGFDLIWPVGFGPAASYLDRTQILASDKTLPLITPAESVTRLHSKTSWLHLAPPSCVAMDADTLRVWGEAQPGPWVLKPTAGSHGTDVQFIDDLSQINEVLNAGTTTYWVLQRYVPEIAQGEYRVILAGGQIIGTYLRQPKNGSHIANLARGGTAQPAELNDAQQRLLQPVVRQLVEQRVGYAAIDLCGDWVMEVNVANPGGLATLEKLYGEAPLARFASSVQAWFAAGKGHST